MKSLLLNGLKLNFIDVNQSSSNTLLFLHGNSHSLKTFSNQMSSALFNDYRLIFVDLPGHGDSSKEGHYSVKNFAQILNEFIITLELQNVVIVGHSMGGHVGINMLKYSRPRGLFIFGTPPLKNPFDSNAFLANSNALALGQEQCSKADLELLMNEMNYQNEFMTLGVEDYLRTDPAFRKEILTDVLNGVHENEISLIKSFRIPVMILLATADRMINNKYILNEFLTDNSNCILSDIESGHSPHIEVSSEFNKILAGFSKIVFEKNYLFNNSLQHESSYEQRNQ